MQDEHRRNLRGRSATLNKKVVSGHSPEAVAFAHSMAAERDVVLSKAQPVKVIMEGGAWMTEDRPVAPHIKALAKKIRERAR